MQEAYDILQLLTVKFFPFSPFPLEIIARIWHIFCIFIQLNLQGGGNGKKNWAPMGYHQCSIGSSL
jgi:hypothetical protein